MDGLTYRQVGLLYYLDGSSTLSLDWSTLSLRRMGYLINGMDALPYQWDKRSTLWR